MYKDTAYNSKNITLQPRGKKKNFLGKMAEMTTPSYHFTDSTAYVPKGVLGEHSPKQWEEVHPRLKGLWNNERILEEIPQIRSLIFLWGGAISKLLLVWFTPLLILTYFIAEKEKPMQHFIDECGIIVLVVAIWALADYLLRYDWYYPFIRWCIAARPNYEFNRLTGMVTSYRRGGKVRFSHPFIEYDCIAIRSAVGTMGAGVWTLFLVHRYSKDKIAITGTVRGSSPGADEFCGAYNMIQRYMDVSKPLPDTFVLEKYRHLDPTTKKADEKSNRDPYYWRKMIDEDEFRAAVETANISPNGKPIRGYSRVINVLGTHEKVTQSNFNSNSRFSKLIFVILIGCIIFLVVKVVIYFVEIQKLKNIEKLAEDAKAKIAATVDYTDPLTGMKFVLVKGGCYRKGLRPSGYSIDRTREVCVDEFYIGKYEVTQEEYEKIIGVNPSFYQSGSRYPVENVSWNDAQAYISDLIRETGKKYRLPTGAEWEYAARSGGKQESYPGGHSIDDVAWYSNNSENKTHAVGTKQPNGLGIFDMSGNVSEWCSDWYGNMYNNDRARQNPKGPSSGTGHTIRGGSWSDISLMVRATFSNGSKADEHSPELGFRLVIDDLSATID